MTVILSSWTPRLFHQSGDGTLDSIIYFRTRWSTPHGRTLESAATSVRPPPDRVKCLRRAGAYSGQFIGVGHPRPRRGGRNTRSGIPRQTDRGVAASGRRTGESLRVVRNNVSTSGLVCGYPPFPVGRTPAADASHDRVAGPCSVTRSRRPAGDLAPPSAAQARSRSLVRIRQELLGDCQVVGIGYFDIPLVAVHPMDR
jgi:hypothetical protein